jgi:hypothetical protein
VEYLLFVFQGCPLLFCPLSLCLHGLVLLGISHVSPATFVRSF